MTSRPFPANPSSSLLSKTRVVFLALTISASLVILASIIFFLYHLWRSLLHSPKTIPFDSSVSPLKLQRFSFRDLRAATADFRLSNAIGKGGSGTVFRGALRTGKLVAIKRLDALSLQADREFQNELQILGGLRSPFLVALLGYCAEKSSRVLVYEYMPNRSLQELLFRDDDGASSLSWERRFAVVLDVARALEFLHLGCDPPVIHGDVKPSNVLLDFDYRAKLSDFGLSRVKVEGDQFGAELFSQDLGRSQELSGNFTAETNTPVESGHNEVDFALALQASSSSKNGRNYKALGLNSASYNANIASEKGKELASSCVDSEWNQRFVPDDQEQELSSVDHSKELANPNYNSVADDPKQWGKDWWWRQDGSGELCSKDYVTEWIGTQILPSRNPNWDEEKKAAPEKPDVNKTEEEPNGACSQGFEFETRDQKDPNIARKKGKKKPRKMQEWWREEHLAEISKKSGGKKRLKSLEIKLRKGLKTPHFDLGRRFYFRRRTTKFPDQDPNDDNGDDKGEFSFRRGWRKRNKRENSCGSDMWSGDLFSRELSSTTSMRGTLCYVAPEYGGFGCLMEKSDIYSLGVLILVIVSGRRPLHVLASPMKLEKANLISWCRQLAQGGNIFELIDERLGDEYEKEQAALCINLALVCLQKTPELRPDAGEVVRILRGEMEVPALPFEFSPSPQAKVCSRSKRKHKLSAA